MKTEPRCLYGHEETRPDIRVEQVYIDRLDEQTYKVRLNSYERILPVWEGVLGFGVRNLESRSFCFTLYFSRNYITFGVTQKLRQ